MAEIGKLKRPRWPRGQPAALAGLGHAVMRAAAVIILLLMTAAAAAAAPGKHQAADDSKTTAGMHQERRSGRQADGGCGTLHRHPVGTMPR